MHKLQQHILRELVLHPSRRYSEIKPSDIEGNFFMYHLGKLIDAGLVEKTSGGYGLSHEGSRYADTFSLKTLTPRVQPKIVTMIGLQNEADEWLLYRHGRAPFNEYVSLPYGKLHFGESAQAAVERELAEKTGLLAELVHRGEVYLLVRQDGEVLSHMLAHVFSGTITEAQVAPTSVGEPFWTHPESFAGPLLPGTTEIIKLLTTHSGPIFEEFQLDLSQ